MTDPAERALAAARARIDRCDDAIHVALAARMAAVADVAAAKAAAGQAGTAFRPGREAQILRRMTQMEPKITPTLVEIVWRQIIAHATHTQQPFTVLLGDPDPQLRDMARAHFGFAPDMQAVPPRTALRALERQPATLGVFPLTGLWWQDPTLGTKLHVVARLPLSGPVRALVISNQPAEVSGQDRVVARVAGLPESVPVLVNDATAALVAVPAARPLPAGAVPLGLIAEAI